MIVDSLDNRHLYEGLSNRFKKAFEFLATSQKKELPVGRYEIDGNDVFALVQSYATKPCNETKWESHQKYIDIQYVLRGEEVIGWTPVASLSETEPYSAQRDITFYDGPADWSKTILTAGYFGIYFPDDGHRPHCMAGCPADVMKIVVKIKL